MAEQDAVASDEASTKETYQDSYKNYADYNGVLRTWFVSFGLGALVLFMLHPEFVTLLRARGHFLLIVFLFLTGCFGQIVVALINKFCSWHVYDAAKRDAPTGRVTAFFYNAFWIDKVIDVMTVGFFMVAIGLMVYDFVISISPDQSSIQPSEFAFESACSEASVKLFRREGLEGKPSDYFQNHWDKKRGKCFVQINSTVGDGHVSIDVYDAFENKRFATFVGHLSCDAALYPANACQSDGGTIWLDGDDEGKGDYHVGFGSAAKYPLGDANTRTEFLAHIRPFMYE